MNTATAEAPTEVASPEPTPAVAMTPKTSTSTQQADSQDGVRRRSLTTNSNTKSRDPEKARAVLRGEISAVDDQGREGKRGAEGDGGSAGGSGSANESAEDDAEVIARMFDPETGEFIEEDEDGDDDESDTTTTRSSRKAPGSRRSGKDSPSSERDAEASAEAQAQAEKEEEQDKEKEEDEEDRKPGPKKRISVTRGRLGDRDFAIVQLADRENISLEEARGRLFGNNMLPAAAASADAGQSAEAREGTTPAPMRESPEAIQARIDGLLEQRKAANKALDVEKATELTDQIADLKLLQRDVWQALQSEAQSRAASHRDAVIASANQAVGLYPDAGVEGKDLFEAIDAERIERERTDPEFFRNPRWPITLAVEVATDLGIAPQAKSSSASASAANTNAAAAAAERKAPALPPKKAARPAPPNPAPGTATGAAQINQEDALRTELKAAKTSKDATAIKAVMRKIDAFHARKR